MPKYKQGNSDRKDESLGMRDGASKGKKQGYKARRDESYGMGKVMGHASPPKSCNVFEPVRSGKNRGYPAQATAYDY